MRWHRSPSSPAAAGVLLCGAVALVSLPIPQTFGTFTAAIANSENTASTAPAFTCANGVLSGPASDLILAYRLDDPAGSTSAPDYSGRGISGNYQGAMGSTTSTPAACPADGPTAAYTLNGSTSFVTETTPFPSTNLFTLELWFKTTVAAGKLIGFGSAPTGLSPSNDRHLYLSPAGNLVFGVYPGSPVTIQSPRTYTDGLWHLADATLSPAGMALYIDGALVAANSAITTGAVYTGYWRIGYDQVGTTWPSRPASPFFTGQLRYAAVYSVALTSTQIAGHYMIGRPG